MWFVKEINKNGERRSTMLRDVTMEESRQIEGGYPGFWYFVVCLFFRVCA